MRPPNLGTAFVLGVATVLALSAVPASAHESGNHGTVKVHDDEVGQPQPTSNNPHVSCDFWIEGFKMSDDSGHIVFELIPPTSNPPSHIDSDTLWTASGPDEPKGFHFLSGPFNFTDLVDDNGGKHVHVRVTVFVDDGHPGSEDHFAKQKVFWVEPCGDDGVEIPFFPSPLALGLAGAGGVAGFAILRRKR